MGFGSFLNEEQAKAIDSAPLCAGKRHPAWAPLFQKQKSAVDFLTLEAADRIAADASLEGWRQTLGMRIADIDNYPDAASALSELRVLSALREVGLNTTPLDPGDTPTPDFLVRDGDEEIVVEVYSKHEDGKETKRREAVAQGADVSGVERRTHSLPGGSVTFTTQILHPGGVPNPSKPFDSVQANVISKLCAAKGPEKQMDANRASVLWLDLSYFIEISKSLIDQTHPLISGHHGLTSGAIWHAFYGWKGAPLADVGRHGRVHMGHDGRFRLASDSKSRLAATLVSFEEGVVLFENPWADRGLPSGFRRACLDLPWFKLENSIANWTPGEASARVEMGKQLVETLAHLD